MGAMNEIMKEMSAYYKQAFGVTPYTEVAAIVKGEKMFLSEHEVRYLQVKCNKCSSKEEFEQFKKDYVIYNGPSFECEIMEFKENGEFSNEFLPGFYDLNINMLFQIL